MLKTFSENLTDLLYEYRFNKETYFSVLILPTWIRQNEFSREVMFYRSAQKFLSGEVVEDVLLYQLNTRSQEGNFFEKMFVIPCGNDLSNF